jgi:hypothetical protein
MSVGGAPDSQKKPLPLQPLASAPSVEGEKTRKTKHTKHHHHHHHHHTVGKDKPTMTLQDGSPKSVSPDTENLHKQTLDTISKKGREKLAPQKTDASSTKSSDSVVKFQEGDRFYGRWKPRAEYMKKAVPDYEERMDRIVAGRIVGGNKSAVIADTVNNQFLGTERNAATKRDDRQYSKEEYNELFSYKGKMEGESKEVKSFRTFMEAHPKYDPRKVSGGDNKSVKIRIGRACKAALEHTTKVKGRNIHFVLDELKTDLVMENLKDASKDRSVTGKEIKWIYRHRDDAKVMKHVKFYRDGKKVSAPWEEKGNDGKRVDKSWDQYDEYRASKHEAKSTSSESVTELSKTQKEKISNKRDRLRSIMKAIKNIFHRIPHSHIKSAIAAE